MVSWRGGGGLNRQCADGRLAKLTSEIAPREYLKSSRCVAEVGESNGSKIGRPSIYRNKHRHTATKCRLGRLTRAVYRCQADTVLLRHKSQLAFTDPTKHLEAANPVLGAGTPARSRDNHDCGREILDI
jgi:hypothetical protein